jgi:hypothetical protein
MTTPSGGSAPNSTSSSKRSNHEDAKAPPLLTNTNGAGAAPRAGAARAGRKNSNSKRYQCLAFVLVMVSVSQLIIGHYLHVSYLETQYFSSSSSSHSHSHSSSTTIQTNDQDGVGINNNSNSNNNPVQKALQQFRLANRNRAPKPENMSINIDGDGTPPRPHPGQKLMKRNQPLGKPNLRKESWNNVKHVVLLTEEEQKDAENDNDTITPKKLHNNNEDQHKDNKDIDVDHIRNVLRKANVEMTPDLEQKLPTYSDFIRMYGTAPIILGLEQCQAFRDAVPAQDRLLGPAG